MALAAGRSGYGRVVGPAGQLSALGAAAMSMTSRPPLPSPVMVKNVLMHKPNDEAGISSWTFQPLRFSRYATAALFGLIPLALLFDTPPGEPFTLILLTVLSEWCAWRGLRLGVVVRPSQVVVQGCLWRRTIPREVITGMTTYPSLIWTGARGQSRKSQVHALAYHPRALASRNTQTRAQSQKLRHDLGLDTLGSKRKRQGRPQANREEGCSSRCQRPFWLG